MRQGQRTCEFNLSTIMLAATWTLLVISQWPSTLNAQGPSQKAPQAKAPQEKTPQANKAKELWFGTMDAETRKFRFSLDLATHNGALSGTLKSWDEGERVFDLSDMTRAEKKLQFKLPKTKAEFQGDISEDGKSVVGKWLQSGTEIPLTFRRVDAVPERKFKAIWKGTINAIIQKLDVAFIELDSGEVLFDSISQKLGGFVVEKEKGDEGEVIFKVPAVRGTFRGKYSEDKTKLEGKWRQGLGSFTLVLSAAKPADLRTAPPTRPQTPKAPFPYEIKDVAFPSKDGKLNFGGTLTTPRGPTRAAVVMISGSGPQDRDESLLDHKPFWVIADHFARHGIATLRYDDRGVGKSTGDFAEGDSYDFANDAEAAFEFLRSQESMRKTPIGLVGHSEGGLIAPIVAARNKHVGFIVLMAGTGVNGEEILKSQSVLVLKAEKSSDEEIEKNSRIQRAIFEVIRKHGDKSNAELLELAMKQMKTDEKKDALDDEVSATLKAAIARMTSRWFKTFLILEPKDSLSKVSCPVLAINGEKDVQVDPKLNLPAIRDALAAAGNKQVEIVEYPGLNHLFQSAKTGGVSEYQEIEETFNIEPLKKMTSWIIDAASSND